MRAELLNRARSHKAIIAITAAFLVVGVIYSLVNPLFEASDELWHYPFVKHLADGNGLPVQQPGVDQPWRQEGSQPPLYYAVAALATAWIDTDDLNHIRWLNPHADMGIPKPDGNVNAVIHTEREWLPCRGAALAVYVVRWISILMGAVTVVLTYVIALELFPGDKALAATASGFVAFNPMFLFVSASVNNDNLATTLATLALWRIIRLLKGDTSWTHLGLLGLLIGFGALSKSSTLGMFALVGLALLIIALRERSWRPLIEGSAIVLGVAVLVSGWWFLRNWRLYGDPTGLNTFVAIVGPRHPTPTLRQLWGERVGFTMSFWGFFGGMNVPMSGWLYQALDILAGIGFVGLVAFGARHWRSMPADGRRRQLCWRILLLTLAWPVIVFASLIRWTLMTIATQGRLMFAAIAAIAVALTLGWLTLTPQRCRKAASAVIVLLFLALAIAAPFAYIAPAYARPEIVTAADIPGDVQRIDADFGGQMELVGFAPLPESAMPGEGIPVTLYWRSLAPMAADYSVFVHFLSGEDLIIGQRDMYPGGGSFPTSEWSPGDIIADRYVVPISPATLTPATAQVEVGLYVLETGARLPVTSQDGTPAGDNVRFGQVAILRPQAGDIPNPVSFDLEDKIALVGFDLDRTAAAPGDAFHLTLYWRALRDLDTNYAVFTQVIGPNHEIWAQKDAWPQDGNAPTATWKEGDLVEDRYELLVKEDAPAGVWDLQVGMYGANDGVRLKLLGEGGHVQDDRILLGKVRIVHPAR